MEWTGSIRWIHNPVQSRRIWIGLDQKFTNSADSGLDWIQKSMCIPYLDLRQFLRIVTLTSEVLPSNLQLFTSSFVFTCRFYKVTYSVVSGLDWTGFRFWFISWIGLGLGSVARGFGTGLDRFNSIHFHTLACRPRSHRAHCFHRAFDLRYLAYRTRYVPSGHPDAS